MYVCLQRRPWAPGAQSLTITELLLLPGLVPPQRAVTMGCDVAALLTSQVWGWGWHGFGDTVRWCMASWCLALPCLVLMSP